MKFITLGEFEENFGTVRIQLKANTFNFIDLSRFIIKILKDDKIVVIKELDQNSTDNQTLLFLHNYQKQKNSHLVIKHAGQICEIEKRIKKNSGIYMV